MNSESNPADINHNNSDTLSSVKSEQLPINAQKQSISSLRIVIYVVVFLAFMASLYGIYVYQQNKINPLNKKIDSLESDKRTQSDKLNELANEIAALKEKASGNYAPGFRGGKSGVELKQPVNTIATQTLAIINTYFKQAGAYPDTETIPMMQLWQDNGYNGASAGGSLKCPDYNGYFSYTGFKDTASNKATTFKLYYCDGSNLITKTQADL